jgi:hypothetical protein
MRKKRAFKDGSRERNKRERGMKRGGASLPPPSLTLQSPRIGRDGAVEGLSLSRGDRGGASEWRVYPTERRACATVRGRRRKKTHTCTCLGKGRNFPSDAHSLVPFNRPLYNTLPRYSHTAVSNPLKPRPLPPLPSPSLYMSRHKQG